MVQEITDNTEFSEVLRLHNYVQKIKKKHLEVHQQSTELRTMFDALIAKAAGASGMTKEKSRKVDSMKKDGDKKWWLETRLLTINETYNKIRI